MKQLTLAGIDVSAKELVVSFARDETLPSEKAIFDNTAAGHKKLARYLTKRGRQARAALEATGIYHEDCALHLADTKGIEVMVLNPKAIKHFGTAMLQRAKTDVEDAAVILEYLKRMDFTAWSPPSPEERELRMLCRRMQQLKEEMNRERNRHHASQHCHGLEKAIQHDIEVNVRHLKKRIVLLEEKGVALVQATPTLNERFELLLSIKGIATTSALQLLSELSVLPADMTAPQWVAHAGLDPKPFESGSSVNKVRRISKSGNKYLRTALYMPAWVAVQYEPHVKAFYEKLIAAGKKPLQAIVAVMRKLLHAIWVMLHSKTAWEAEKFYTLPQEETVA